MDCEKCGTQMLYFRDQSTCGRTYPKCGWGVATAYRDPAEQDECVYTIAVLPQDVGLDAVK